MKFATVLVALLAMVSIGLAQEDWEKEYDDNSGTAYQEGWYTYWGLGGASVSYTDEVDDALDEMVDDYDLDRMQLTIDMLGFYWPINNNTILGFVINAAADRIYDSDDWFQYNSYLYSASAIYYPGSEFGSGVFLRGDVGMAAFVATDSDENSENGEKGFGFLVGGGYSINLGGTRILLNVNYAHRSVEFFEIDKVSVIGFSVGGLF